VSSDNLVLFNGVSSSHAAELVDNPEDLSSGTVTVHMSKKKTKDVLIYCLDGVPGKVKEKSSGTVFTSYAQLMRKLKKNPKKKRKVKQFKKIRRAGEVFCEALGLPVPTPAPTAGPSLTPTAAPTPSQDGYFDVEGNVTEQGRILFEIPQGLPANILTGRDIWNATCTCHTEAGRRNRSFSDYRQATALPPMFFNSTSLVDGDLAQITAFLNRLRP